MDNSLLTFRRKVEEMIDEMKRFASYLNHHVIIQPENTLRDAVRQGFPVDIAQTYDEKYYRNNVSDAEEAIRRINNDCIPYLTDVALYIESAMNRGGSNSGNTPNGTSTSTPRVPLDPAVAKNYRDLSNALGIAQKAPMSIEEADKQNANPKHTHQYYRDPEGDVYCFDGKYYKPWMKFPQKMLDNWDKVIRCRENPDYKEEYSVNCATCATAYALRLRGFDVKAKGNPGKDKPDSLNYKISDAEKYPDLWKNTDGTNAEPVHTDDWMRANGKTGMTPEDYRKYFEETCKENGVYVVMIKWNGVGGHATILQRDGNGLHYIEPQVYDSQKGADGRRKIDDLLYRVSFDGKLIPRLSPNPRHGYGILRVDNKLFNVKYADLFDIK